MSTLVNPSRMRAPRTAGPAIERARLAVVPTRTSRAPRAPFAVLVFVLLAVGVVGLLMFNTHMQQSSFYATKLEQRADALTAKRQALEMEIAGLRDPQHIGEAARGLGMCMPPVPAFISLSDGAITGDPTVCTSADATRINPNKAFNKFADLKPIKVFAPPPTGTENSGQTQVGDGPASGGGATTNGRNDAPSR
jgi:hypothetical protein